MFPRLFTPWLLGNRNRFFSGTTTRARSSFIGLLGLGLCLLIYWGSHRVLGYFHGQNELGILLSLKIFQMMWVLLFAMLIFSVMVSSVSALYLSADNEILLSAPISPRELFQMRFFTVTGSTSWMVLIFTLPVFIAYGVIFQASPLYYLLMVLATLTVSLSASALAMSFTVLLIYLFPAKRTKDIILYLSLCFGLFLYLIFRLIQPENLVNPDQYGQYIEYFSAISAPAGPWLPAGWAANLLSNYLLDRKLDMLGLGLLLTTPCVLYFLGEILMDRLFISGFSKSQESFGGFKQFRPVSGQGALASSPVSWVMRKELKQFTRDSGQWSQFFMIGALIVVYLYNFKALPLDRSPLPTVYISNLIGFANIGLAGFIAASLATRFVYPSISAERGAFYLIHSSPLSLSGFLFCKYLFYVIPFSVLITLLITVSNHLLQISGPMYWISLFSGLIITWTVLGMGLGFGALFADFKAENINAATGPGAILFLFCAVLYQILFLGLGLAPTYRVVRHALRHGYQHLTDIVLLASWGVGMTLLSVLLCSLLWRQAIKKLDG